jgi:ATP-binding cassette subfamily F protein 3
MEERAAPDVRTRVRAILGSFLFGGEDAGKKVSVLSGGERARLALACMILSQTNLLIMDEPTHHLDIPAKQRLKEALTNYPGALIIISHDRDFLKGLTTRTIEFGGGVTTEYIGDIDEMLAKKGIDDLVTMEEGLARQASSPGQVQVNDRQNSRERKAMQNRISALEKEIGQKEQLIKEMEAKLADPVFYQSGGFEKEVKVYETCKTDLARLTKEWEGLVDGLQVE